MASRMASVVLVTVVAACAQNVPAGGAIHAHESGFSFRLPAGWSVQDNARNSLILPPGVRLDPTRNDNSEAYIVGSFDGYRPADEQQFVGQLSSEFAQGGVTVIRAYREALAARGRQASVYTWEVRDAETRQNQLLRFYLVPDGQRALVIIALGEAARVASRDAELRAAAANLEFRAAKPPAPNEAIKPPAAGAAVKPLAAGDALADNTPAAREWLEKLRGRVIRQFYGGGGTSGEKRRFLAADGTYSMSGNVVTSATVPGATASGTSRMAGSGRWKIRDVNGQIFLQLVEADGQVHMLPITRDARNWYLDGQKAFAVNP